MEVEGREGQHGLKIGKRVPFCNLYLYFLASQEKSPFFVNLTKDY